MDSLNVSVNQISLCFAVNGFKREWKPKQAFLSPKYTTDINELFKVSS